MQISDTNHTPLLTRSQYSALSVNNCPSRILKTFNARNGVPTRREYSILSPIVHRRKMAHSVPTRDPQAESRLHSLTMSKFAISISESCQESQSPKGTMGSPWDSHVPPRPPQSHCPSHPKVPRGPWECPDMDMVFAPLVCTHSPPQEYKT